MQEVRAMDEARLHAFADGQLDAAAAAEVAAWLQDHPADAQRVLDWRSQRTALQALHAEMLDEPLPAALRQGLRRGARRLVAANGPRYRVQALAGICVLGLGLALGWSGHAWLAGDGAAATPAAAMMATPGFVRDAGIAHAVYLPERRHPVEVGAEQQEHLVQWLSKRLGQPLRVPHLEAQGWRLMGGRLLPAGEADTPEQARAQFMYEESAGSGERLTLYVSVVPPGQEAPTAFRFSEQPAAGGSRSFFWVDGRLGYALTGRLAPEALARLGEQVYRQLQARPQPQ